MKCLKVRDWCIFLMVLEVLFNAFATGQNLKEEEPKLLMRTASRNVLTLLDKIEGIESKLESLEELHATAVMKSSCKDEISKLYELITRDECRDGTHNCSQWASCIDKPVLFGCTCNPGYSGNGYTCTDINECLEDVATCPDSCENTEGSYKCRCDLNFKWTGSTCEHPRCPQPSLYIEDLGCITPVLTEQTWLDSKVQCQGMGMRLLEGISDDHLYTISDHFMDVMGYHLLPWIGFKEKKWLSSSQRVPDELVSEDESEYKDGCGFFDLGLEAVGLGDANCSYSEYSFCQLLL